MWYHIEAIYKEAEKAVSYILKRYHKYKKLWNKQFSKRLLEHILWDHAIKLKLEISLRFYLIYKLTETE